MVVIKLGKWRHKANSMFVYDRVYRNGYEWTPFCLMRFRYVSRWGERGIHDQTYFDHYDNPNL